MVSFQRITGVFRRSKSLSTKAQELLEAKPSLWQWRLVVQVLDDELAEANEWMEAATRDISVQWEESDSDPELILGGWGGTPEGPLNAPIASTDASLAETKELESVARQMGLKGDLFYPEMVEAWSKWMTAQLATERNKLEETMAGFDVSKPFDHDEFRAIIEFAQLVGQSYRRLLQLELQCREPRELGLYSRVRELWASAIRRGAIADIQTCCSEMAQQVEILVDGKGYKQPDPQINFARTYPENDIPDLLESIRLEEIAPAQAELADLPGEPDTFRRMCDADLRGEDLEGLSRGLVVGYEAKRDELRSRAATDESAGREQHALLLKEIARLEGIINQVDPDGLLDDRDQAVDEITSGVRHQLMSWDWAAVGPALSAVGLIGFVVLMMTPRTSVYSWVAALGVSGLLIVVGFIVWGGIREDRCPKCRSFFALLRIGSDGGSESLWCKECGHTFWRDIPG